MVEYMLYQIVRLSFTNNPPQSRRVVSAFFSPPLAEHRRVVLWLCYRKMTFFGKEVSAYRSNSRLIINIFAVKQQKKQIFFGVHNKNDYICQHPNGLNNRMYRKY